MYKDYDYIFSVDYQVIFSHSLLVPPERRRRNKTTQNISISNSHKFFNQSNIIKL